MRGSFFAMDRQRPASAPSNRNRRCVCGFDVFRQEIQRSTSTVNAWVQYEASNEGSGLGSTPLGGHLGSSGSGGSGWGWLEGTLRIATSRVTCTSCGRVRQNAPLSSLAVYGTYVTGRTVYIVGSHGLRNATCYRLRITGPGGVYEAPFGLGGSPQPLVLNTPPLVTQPTPTPGEPRADTLLVAQLPDVSLPGTYTLELVDGCFGYTVSLGTLELEIEPMLLHPTDATLNGLPALRTLLRQHASAAAPGSGGRVAIPFDYCAGVLEYDARLGTLPDAQGWTHGGSGNPADFQLVNGRMLRLISATDTYYEKEVVLPASPSKSTTYGRVSAVDANAGSDGDGLVLDGRHAPNAAAFRGSKFCLRDGESYLTDLGDTSEYATSDSVEEGFTDFLIDTDANGSLALVNNTQAPRLLTGSVGTAAAHTLRAVFGDVGGTGVSSADIQNFVVSTPGRFMRAKFDAYALVTNPVIRLYLYADTLPTVDNSARILVKYGNISDANDLPTLAVSQTQVFATSNLIYEVPIQLTGLTADRPFTFTVERDWTHPEDTMQATMWMVYASIRSS